MYEKVKRIRQISIVSNVLKTYVSIEDFFPWMVGSRVFRRDFNDCKYEQRFKPLSLIGTIFIDELG